MKIPVFALTIMVAAAWLPAYAAPAPTGSSAIGTSAASAQELRALTKLLLKKGTQMEGPGELLIYLSYRRGELQKYITAHYLPSSDKKGLWIYRWDLIREMRRKNRSGGTDLEQWIIGLDGRGIITQVSRQTMVFEDGTRFKEAIALPTERQETIRIARGIITQFVRS